jgi:hypothetical protein
MRWTKSKGRLLSQFPEHLAEKLEYYEFIVEMVVASATGRFKITTQPSTRSAITSELSIFGFCDAAIQHHVAKVHV